MPTFPRRTSYSDESRSFGGLPQSQSRIAGDSRTLFEEAATEGCCSARTTRTRWLISLINAANLQPECPRNPRKSSPLMGGGGRITAKRPSHNSEKLRKQPAQTRQTGPDAQDFSTQREEKTGVIGT